MLERALIVFLMLESASQREAQLCLIGVIAAFSLQQGLHRRDFGIAEHIILELGEAPIAFTEGRVEIEASLVGLLGLAAIAQRLVQMSDREAQADFAGIEARG